MDSTHRGRTRIIGVAATAALAFSTLGMPASAQGPTLCDALSLDDLHALSGMRYGESVFASDSSCFLETAPDQQGRHAVTLNLRPIPFAFTFEEMLEVMSDQGIEHREVTVGGRPGYIDDSTPDALSVLIHIGDDDVFSVTASVADSAELGDLDSIQYALDIAELVVPALDAASLATTAAQDPPDMEGVTWRTSRSLSGAELESAVEGPERELWDLLLAAASADFAKASVLDATAHHDEDGRMGQLSTFRIEGADARSLVPVLTEWLTNVGGDVQYEFENAEVAARGVTRALADGEAIGLIYATGDTLHVLTMPEEVAVQVLQQLP